MTAIFMPTKRGRRRCGPPGEPARAASRGAAELPCTNPAQQTRPSARAALLAAPEPSRQAQPRNLREQHLVLAQCRQEQHQPTAHGLDVVESTVIALNPQGTPVGGRAALVEVKRQRDATRRTPSR